MDSKIISELTQDNSSKPPEEVYLWLFRIHEACSKATQPAIRLIAEPVGKALEIVKALGENATEAQKVEAGTQMTGLLFQARVLMIFALLEELNRFRNVIAAEAARLKADSPQHKKAIELQATYERTINALALAYEELRHGRSDRLDEASHLLADVQKAALELKK